MIIFTVIIAIICKNGKIIKIKSGEFMEKQIKKWLEKGIITEDKYQELLLDYKEEREKNRKKKIQITLYVVGALLFGLGIISFVAANDWIIKLLESAHLLKILLLSSLTIGCFYGGFTLAYEKKTLSKLGKALIFLSALLIGGVYALIGQTYNIRANSSSLYFLWFLSVVPLAYIYKEKSINILSLVLFVISSIFFYTENAEIQKSWFIYFPILMGLFLYSVANIPIIKKEYNDFSFSYKKLSLITIFISLLSLSESKVIDWFEYSLYLVVPTIASIGIVIFNIFKEKEKDKLFKLETGFLFILALLLLIMPKIPVYIIANLLIITIISGGFYYGYKFEENRLVSLSSNFMVIYLLLKYFTLMWSFMNKSLFFILGGLLLLGSAYFLEKQKKKIKGGEVK